MDSLEFHKGCEDLPGLQPNPPRSTRKIIRPHLECWWGCAQKGLTKGVRSALSVGISIPRTWICVEEMGKAAWSRHLLFPGCYWHDCPAAKGQNGLSPLKQWAKLSLGWLLLVVNLNICIYIYTYSFTIHTEYSKHHCSVEQNKPTSIHRRPQECILSHTIEYSMSTHSHNWI